MADEPAGRTSLGVLHEILNNLGDSNTYITVVDALEALLNVLGSGGIGQAVSDWLAAHPEATTTVQNGSITLLKLANDVKEAINGKAASSDLQALANDLEALAQTVAEKADASDLDDKADIDGYYSQLTAGLAENLIGRGDAVPAEYLYRTAGGTADIEDGIATIDCIKGNTLVWNQLCESINASGFVRFGTDTATVQNHKYLCIADIVKKEAAYNASVVIYGKPIGGSVVPLGRVSVLTSGRGSSIFTMSTDGLIGGASSVEGNYWGFTSSTAQSASNVMLFDLTLMFGSGNEPATVAEFEAMFPLPYYPYSAPKLLPVDIRGIETVGFNLWDEEWEVGTIDTVTGQNVISTQVIRSKNYIPVFPNTQYHMSSSTGYQYAYDADKNFIGIFRINNVPTPSNCRYIRFRKDPAYGTTYKGDLCINLSWSGYRNGEYEEHWSAERPIDTSRFFPTGMKKVGDKADALYADHYDTVVGAVDLGTLTWIRAADTSGHPYFYTSLYGYPSPAVQQAASLPNAFCAIYQRAKFGDLYNDYANVPDGSIGLTNGTANDTVYIKDDATADAAALKTKLSGVILYYELAEPIEVAIDPPLNLSYKVSDFGTERIMVDETVDAPQTAPVPMEVEYGINAIDTIRRLPKEYQSHKSMGQFETALASSLGVDITETWDETEQRYEYEVSDFELSDDTFACIAAPDGPTATANHAVGTYLTMGGKLYKVTTAIAAGDTIAAGTNVTQTTVMDELIALTT